MKIVSITLNFADPALGIIPFRSHYQHLQDEMVRVEDVVLYGRGKGLDPETDVLKIVEKEEPDILFFTEKKGYKNIEKVETPKFMFCSDSWANIFNHTMMLNRWKFNGALILYPSAIPFYSKYTKCDLHPFPYAVDPEHFKDMGLEREHDVFCSGSFSAGSHPLRHKLLQEAGRYPDIKFHLSKGHGMSFVEYVKALNRSKIFCFDNVYLNIPQGDRQAPRIRFAIEKWVEAMACGMLAMAPAPDYAEGLHFETDVNFVDVNTDNFMEKISYYLDNEDERRLIARRGKETVMKHHTVETRVKQLTDIFREALD